MRFRSAVVAGALAVGVAIAACSSPDPAPASTPAGAPPAITRIPEVSVAPPVGPLVAGPGDPRFIDASLPLLPNNLGYSPRPADYVKVVYAFAAQHADVLKYVPCFCGCERLGHHANDECFIARRSATGKVVEWEPHGVICEVCLDVAHEAMQLHNTGASIDQIRAAVDRKWATPGTSHTDTPMPPSHRGGL
jgi:hypothetical protein